MNLKTLFLSLFLIVLLILPAGIALAAEDAIAVVIAAEGSGYVRRDGRDIPLELKDRLVVSDTILTGADGKLQLLFNDNSTISVGADSLLELREFADAGAQSKFDAHLGQGALRIITGWLTEANPAGFKMTTPLGTIGIRGTILNIETDDQHTVVRVLNTDKKVLVNDVNVAENFKIILARGQEPRVSKMEPGERERADNDFSIRSKGGGLKGIKSAPLENVNVDLPDNGGLMNDLTEHPMTIPTPSPTNAMIVGSLGMGANSISVYSIDNFSGSFSFDVNLQTGQVTNAAMSGYGNNSGTTSIYIDFNFTGGSGTISSNWYDISNFTSGYLGVNNPTSPLGSPTSDPAVFTNSLLIIDGGTNNFANVGDTTGPGSEFRVTYNNLSTYPVTSYNVYEGTADGTRTQ